MFKRRPASLADVVRLYLRESVTDGLLYIVFAYE